MNGRRFLIFTIFITAFWVVVWSWAIFDSIAGAIPSLKILGFIVFEVILLCYVFGFTTSLFFLPLFHFVGALPSKQISNMMKMLLHLSYFSSLVFIFSLSVNDNIIMSFHASLVDSILIFVLKEKIIPLPVDCKEALFSFLLGTGIITLLLLYAGTLLVAWKSVTLLHRQFHKHRSQAFTL